MLYIIYIIYKSFVLKNEEGNRLKYITLFFVRKIFTVRENRKVVNPFQQNKIGKET